MISIKFRIPLVVIAVLIFLLLSSCGKIGDDSISEVDMKKDLSVQITYRQISCDSILSFKNNVLFIDITQNDKFPDGLSCEISKSGIVLYYSDMKKSYDYENVPDVFLPKILYEFFSLCGDSFKTEQLSEEGSYIERNICGKDVCFQIKNINGKEEYFIEIK